MRFHYRLPACFTVLIAASCVLYGRPAADTVKVPLSDPSRPAMVKAHLISGGITVEGYEGKEVIVEATARGGSSESESRQAPPGMKRIPMTGTGLRVEEENNVVDIGTSSFNSPVDLVIRVPHRSSLDLKTVNDGDVDVKNVEGEIDVTDINGAVRLTGISGSAVVHALNGDITATFVSVAPDKPMSFSSMNGNIDVTFPVSTKADLVMKTNNGEIFSDFDINIAAGTEPTVEKSEGKGKYVIRIERAVHGTINGGGPEYQFKNFNGDIYIRKGK